MGKNVQHNKNKQIKTKQNKQKTVGTYAASKHVENWLKKKTKNNISNMPAMYSFVGMTE